MAKQAKEKENLDFFYLGEKKVEPNKSKNKNVVKSKNETKTVSPKKKSPRCLLRRGMRNLRIKRMSQWI